MKMEGKFWEGFACNKCAGYFEPSGEEVPVGEVTEEFRHEGSCEDARFLNFLETRVVLELESFGLTGGGEWWALEDVRGGRRQRGGVVLPLARLHNLRELMHWHQGVKLEDLRAVRYTVPSWVSPEGWALFNVVESALPACGSDFANAENFDLVTLVHWNHCILLWADSSVVERGGGNYSVVYSNFRSIQKIPLVDEVTGQVLLNYL